MVAFAELESHTLGHTPWKGLFLRGQVTPNQELSSLGSESMAIPRCLTNACSPDRISLALSKKRVTAVTRELVACSQTNVREQSRVVYYNGNIITIFGV